MSTTEDIDAPEYDSPPPPNASSLRSSSSSGLVASTESAFDYDSLPPLESIHWDPNSLEAVDNITNQPISTPYNQPISKPTRPFENLPPGLFLGYSRLW